MTIRIRSKVWVFLANCCIILGVLCFLSGLLFIFAILYVPRLSPFIGLGVGLECFPLLILSDYFERKG